MPTRRVSGTIVSNPTKAYMSKAKAGYQLRNKGGKAVRALASRVQISLSTPYVYLFIYFILFATLITKNIGKEEEEKKKRSGEET